MEVMFGFQNSQTKITIMCLIHLSHNAPGMGRSWTALGSKGVTTTAPPLASGSVLFKSISISVLMFSHVHGVRSLVNEALNPMSETQIHFFPTVSHELIEYILGEKTSL